MSTQRGNVSRTRSQKYKNTTKFKNDLHDKSHIIKKINKLEIANVCVRCKDVIEWKIKYKKYKPLNQPATCVSCHNKNVKHAYHTLCTDCATKLNVCPKCGKVAELVESRSDFDPEEFLKTAKAKSLLQALTEKKRRMFYRLLRKGEDELLTNEEGILEKLESLKIQSNKSTSIDDCNDDFDLSDFDD